MTHLGKIIVNICTCKRPIMLKECLNSIIGQKIPENWLLEIHIIDNDPNSILEKDILYWTATSNYKIRYFKETKIGIPYARNTACSQSIVHQADWIVFIDDDEIALPNWLNAFIEATKKWEADAFTGPVQYIFPGKTGRWLSNPNDNNTQDGARKKRASTNNVMIAKHVIANEGMNLCFDEKMAFMGGSDTDFFMRLTLNNGVIRFIKHAVVSETVLLNRTKIWWRLKRQYRSSCNRIYIHKKLFGIQNTTFMAAKECIRHLIDGVVSFFISPIFLLMGWHSFKKRYYHSLRHLAKGLGNIAGVLGLYPQPYKSIDGH